MELFWEHGYEGVSTARLGEAMGIASPSLYAAFGSKQELYAECLELYGQRYGNYLAATLAGPQSARDSLDNVLRQACQVYTGKHHPRGCMVATSGLQAAPDVEAAHAPAQDMRRNSKKLIEQRLLRAVKEGELAPGTDCDALAAYFALVIQGLAVQARDGASLQKLLRMVDVVMAAWPGEPAPPRV